MTRREDTPTGETPQRVHPDGGQRGRGGCLVFLLLVLFAAASTGAAVWMYAQSAFLDADIIVGNDPIDVRVPPGADAASMVELLMSDGHILNSEFWPIWLRIRRPGGCLKAGDHRVPGAATPEGLFAALCSPAFAPGVRVTIPEGTNSWQLADMIAAAGLASRDRILELAFDPEFASELGLPGNSLEGWLAPDTYEFASDASAEDILRQLHAQQQTVLRQLAVPESAASELLTVASIVEEEAQVAAERPIIAAVIHNRLAAGMPLQCDPTCVYSADLYDTVPTRRACRDPSNTHSTYVLPALPPTPISNPGRASIEAALHPAEDPDVLYFVAFGDGTGRHAFADTLSAHNRNVDQYIRGR